MSFFNKKHLSQRKAVRRIVAGLMISVTVIGATLSAFAVGDSAALLDASPNAAELLLSPLGLSTVVLGVSGEVTEINTVSDMVELSKTVAEGNTLEGRTFQLQSNIDLKDADDWTPIGTLEHPFSGTFDGNGFEIRGIGSLEIPSLFGFVKGATLKNITIMSSKFVGTINPYVGLFVQAEKSTIQNCIVIPVQSTFALRAMLRSGLASDSSWTNTNSITTPAQLWNLAEQVVGGNNFKGETITINVTMTEDYNREWIGIGSLEADYPFSGTASGHVKNLAPNKTGAASMGLFAYTENATLEDFTLENVNVVGGDNVGALVGYAKNTKITNSSVAGTIKGVNAVGGLVGTYVVTGGNKATTSDQPQPILGTVVDYEDSFADIGASIPDKMDSPIHTVYSTADVEGFYEVGGLIGKITGETYVFNGVLSFDPGVLPYDGLTTDGSLFNNPPKRNMYIVNTAFATGSVTGSVAVGGAIGSTDSIEKASHENPNNDFIEAWSPSGINSQSYFVVANIASSSSIRGDGAVGGVVGTTSESTLTLSPPVRQAYFSGTIQAYTHTGGIVGYSRRSQSVVVKDSYVSGFIVVPDAKAAGVWYASGSNEFGIPTSDNVWADPYSIYSTSEPMQTEKKVISGSGTAHIGKGAYWLDNIATGSIAGFTSNPMVYTNGYTNSTFPRLDAFGSATPPFQTFSEISTNPNLRSIPLYMTRNAAGELEKIGFNGNSPMLLDTVNGQVSWGLGKEDGSTTNYIQKITTPDITLQSEENSLEIKGQNIMLAEKASESFVFDLVYDVPSLGMEAKQVVTVLDETIRPIYETTYIKFHETKEAAKADSNGISLKDKKHFIQFTESLRNAGLTVTLVKYDANFANPTGVTEIINAADLKIIANNTLRVDFTNTTINTGDNFALEIAGGSFEDQQNAQNDLISLFFKVAVNQKPEIIFDATLPIAETTSTTEQVISLVENDPRYLGNHQGMTIQDDLDYLDFEDANLNQTIELVDPYKKTAADIDGYQSVVNLDTFISIPGEYTVKYAVTDSDGTVSDPAYRIYKIHGEAKVMQGNQPYKVLRATLSDKDTIDVYNQSIASGQTMAEALDQEIYNRYVKTVSDEQVSAYYYDSNASKTDMDITFDTAPYLGTGTDFLKGVETAANFTTSDGAKHMYILSLASLEPRLEIQLDHTNYVAENGLSVSAAMRHFGAKVYNKETGKYELGHKLYINWKDIDRNKIDKPQELTFSLSEKPEIVAGVDITVYAKATVTMTRNNKWKHPEDKPDIPMTFWDATNDMVKDHDGDRVYNFAMDYNSSEYAPTDFFIHVANKDNVVANLNLPSGITLTVSSDTVDKTLVNSIYTNLRVERVYDMYVDRQSNGLGTHQFKTAEEIQLPGIVTLSMPLDPRLHDAKQLNLYYIDYTTQEYVLVRKLDKTEYANETLTLEMTEFKGDYVITEANFS